MDEKPAQEKSGLSDLIRNVLSNPSSEQAIQAQMIDLARRNLHLPEVLAALIEVLPQVRDTGIQRQLLGVVMNLDTSRFESLDRLHDAMMEIFRNEKERTLRAALISRFSAAMHQDERLAPFLIDMAAQPIMTDEERAAVSGALAALPVISSATAIQALERARQAPAPIQSMAVAIAEGCPEWNDAMAAALGPFLEPRVQRDLRLRILDRLAKAKVLKAAYFPLLRQILRQDQDRGMRGAALELLRYIKDWDGSVMTQLLWTSGQDADEELRARATQLLKEAPDLPNEYLEAMVKQLHSDAYEGVRTRILGILKPRMGQVGIRNGVIESFSSNPGAFEDEELNQLLDLIAPYASRDAALRETLLRSASRLLRAAHRKRLLDLVLPKLRSEESVPWLLDLFQKETDESLRQTLFAHLRPLSLAKHADLVPVFCKELTEPSSPFRQVCAEMLAASSELYPDIAAAFEDVLLYDQDVPLVRACLDGYLKPKVVRHFNALLSVVGNEMLDALSRQKCLEQITRDGLTAEQSDELSKALAGLKSPLRPVA